MNVLHLETILSGFIYGILRYSDEIEFVNLFFFVK